MNIIIVAAVILSAVILAQQNTNLLYFQALYIHASMIWTTRTRQIKRFVLQES
jgi:hypothetical protein